ncbi:hypothetical protein JGZ12_09050 [Staphylococcus pseudintermedius]|uniref:phage tail spike protein n=1 Tax=Staphylococcus pseudintermedius TaxID=283734 RepID=UPI0018F5C99B|nr:phage tail spike protein [Staphylococcus pseudintermedius]MBJ8232857.1 hypothetical protein [Staphylococcus pseudintermedius]
MIHVMNFKGEIVDFIAQSDSAVIQAVHKRDINERIETFDFTILSERTTYMQERNRIVIQDKNGQYREFIIDRISADIEGYTEVETVASYLEDITKARPYAPGKLEKMTTKQALSDVLKDTGWQVSDATEYDGLRTTSWTSYQTRYDVLLQLCTTYKMMADFYIEVGSNRVDKRLVVLRKRNPLFKGKEITYGKDLTGLKRTVDFSEIKTALLCVGPEPEEGKKRVELVVKDDESQAKYGLPGRYNWGIYEPETEDQNMTEKRLRTLGTTELNKRKSEVITYEVTAIDIEKEYKHEIVNLGDMVRIKNRDFTPPLYVEAEVISEEYDLISKDVTYGFGTYKEFKESDLRSSFDRKLDAIRQKVSDGLSNVNTIVRESLEGELQYFERKISKGDTPPDNPVNDLLWLDTSNPEVAVLRRYWNGEWIKSSAENADDVGAITREQALYSELNNTFVNLTIQHSRLIHEVSDVLESEYLVDTDIKEEVNSKLNETIGVFNTIKSNLDSMTSETATIGKLVDTQALFLEYREKLQALYNAVENAKIAIDQRFKLLQSQYTDEKFNEALNNVASKLGLTVNEDNQLVGEVDVSKQINESVREMTNEMLRDYVTSTEYQSDKNGIIERLNSADTERQQLSNEISDRVTLSEYNSGIDSMKQYADEQVNNLTLGNVNLIKSYKSPEYLKTATVEDDYSLLFLTTGKTINIFFYDANGYINVPLEANTDYILKLHEADENIEMGVFYNKGRNIIKTYTKDRIIRFNTGDKEDFRIILIARDANLHAGKLSLYKGTKELDWTPNPEDVQKNIDNAETNAKQYADTLKQQQDKVLTTYDTRITQNGKDIEQRATKEEYNASKQLLDKTIAQVVTSAVNGVSLSYNDNGTISDLVLNDQGVSLNSSLININQGDVVIENGVTTIKNLSSEKIKVAFNNISTSLSMTGNGLETWENGQMTSLLNGGGHHFYNNTFYVGYIGTSVLTVDSYTRGLSLSLQGAGNFMAFTYSKGKTNPDDASNVAMMWSKGIPGYRQGFFYNEDIVIRDTRVLETAYLRPYGMEPKYRLMFSGRVLEKQEGVGIQYNSVNGSGIHFSNASINIISKTKDGGWQGMNVAGDYITSNAIYNRTYSSASNVYITSYGTLGRSTSASKYKLSQEKQFNDEEQQYNHSKKILNLDIKTWFDKFEAETYAREILTGERQENENFKLKRYAGLIAEDVESVGLKEFVTYGKDKEIEGIEYDRLWIHLIPILKKQNEEIEKLKSEMEVLKYGK